MSTPSRRALLAATAATGALALAAVTVPAALDDTLVQREAELRAGERQLDDRVAAVARTHQEATTAAVTGLRDAQTATAAGIGAPEEVAPALHALARLQDEHVAVLRATATLAPPARPSSVPVSTGDAALRHTDALGEQSLAVADAIDTAAHHARGILTAADELHTAADAALDRGELPTSDAPAEVAAVWADDGELAAYRDAVETASQHEALLPLAEVHRELIEHLETVSDAATGLEEDVGIDAYEDARRALADATDDLAERLREATTAVAATALEPLRAAEELALGLQRQSERAPTTWATHTP